MAARNDVASESDFVTISIPRSAVTVVERPRCVSQLTSEKTIGVHRREFLRVARNYAKAGGTVLAVGKLRLVELDPLMEWLKLTAKPAVPDDIKGAVERAVARAR